MFIIPEDEKTNTSKNLIINRNNKKTHTSGNLIITPEAKHKNAFI